jgi:8-oxo-dGTP diphosphatase
MLRRVKKQNDIHYGKWNGLGGKLEPGETPEECVRREIEEESGLRIKNPRMCGVLTFPFFKDGEDWYVFVYTASKFEGQLIESPEGELKWIDDESLLELNLWEGDKYFLEYIRKGVFFSGKFVYEDKKLVSHEIWLYPLEQGSC